MLFSWPTNGHWFLRDKTDLSPFRIAGVMCEEGGGEMVCLKLVGEGKLLGKLPKSESG